MQTAFRQMEPARFCLIRRWGPRLGTLSLRTLPKGIIPFGILSCCRAEFYFSASTEQGADLTNRTPAWCRLRFWDGERRFGRLGSMADQIVESERTIARNTGKETSRYHNGAGSVFSARQQLAVGTADYFLRWSTARIRMPPPIWMIWTRATSSSEEMYMTSYSL